MSLAPGAAHGLVVVEDVVAPSALPAFDGSAMDGYAVRAAETATATVDAPVRLALVDEARAGHPARGGLAAGQAWRISTGARVSGGTDAVVRVEDAEESGGELVLRAPVAAGHDVRSAGEDFAPGDIVVRAGTPLHPGLLAALAGLGVTAIDVWRPPTVSVLVTGDEVTPAGVPLADGGVHDIHGVALPALLRAAGCGAVDVAHVGDDADATLAALRAAPGDVLVTCGGMSVGRHDHVRRAAAALGVRELVGAVRMKPGAPTSLGVLPGARGDRAFLGLPGNPSAALVGAILLGVPLLRAMAGAAPPRTVLARLGEPVRRAAGRHLALWVRAEVGEDAVLTAWPAGPQHAHRLRTPAGASALAIVAPGDDEAPAGDLVPVVPIPGAAFV